MYNRQKGPCSTFQIGIEKEGVKGLWMLRVFKTWASVYMCACQCLKIYPQTCYYDKEVCNEDCLDGVNAIKCSTSNDPRSLGLTERQVKPEWLHTSGCFGFPMCKSYKGPICVKRILPGGYGLLVILGVWKKMSSSQCVRHFGVNWTWKMIFRYYYQTSVTYFYMPKTSGTKILMYIANAEYFSPADMWIFLFEMMGVVGEERGGGWNTQ